MFNRIFCLCVILVCGAGCSLSSEPIFNNAVNTQLASFNNDIDIMSVYHKPIVLVNGDSRLAVLAEYQGRVMTSSATGGNGESYGWIDRKNLLTETKTDGVGGADRLWFGPETGEFSLFFKPGTARVAENISLQEAMSTQVFDVVSTTDNSVAFRQNITLENHKGYKFSVLVDRDVTLFDKTTIERQLGITYKLVNAVGFGSNTSITNVGADIWSRDSGLISIWSLGAFLANNSTTVIIPVKNKMESLHEYFSPIKESHTRIISNAVYYRADAQYLNKIGIPPEHTKPIMGSYDSTRKLLTVVTFQFDNNSDDTYVNSVWYPQNADPYKGDVINVFNGGVENGKSLFGPFYELESSSHAKPLKVNETLSHFQNTYHFQGGETELNAIAIKLFGASLDKFKSIF